MHRSKDTEVPTGPRQASGDISGRRHNRHEIDGVWWAVVSCCPLLSCSIVKVTLQHAMPTKQTEITVFLALVLLVSSLSGLYFHAHDPASVSAPSTLTVVHAGHIAEHAACHGDGCTDLSIDDFWKSLDPDWNLPALLITLMFVFPPLAGSIIARIPRDQRTGIYRPLCLRPPLRAPPR